MLLLDRSRYAVEAKSQLRDFLFRLPKVSLHEHLDGSLRPQTILEAQKHSKISNAIPAANENELMNLIYKNSTGSLTQFLKNFDLTCEVMNLSKIWLYRVASEVAEDLALQNVLYAEVRFAPHQHLTTELKKIDQVVSIVNEAFAASDIPTYHLILCWLKHRDLEELKQLIVFIRKAKLNGLQLSLDVAGPEIEIPEEAVILLKKATESGINLTYHVGEIKGDEDEVLRRFEQAIRAGASRIGHGVNIPWNKMSILNSNTLVFPNKQRWPISTLFVQEICPVSNLVTGSLSDLNGIYKSNGITLKTFSADDSLMCGHTLTDEFVEMYESFDHVNEFLITYFDSQMNGIIGAFGLSNKQKQRMIKRMRTDLEMLKNFRRFLKNKFK